MKRTSLDSLLSRTMSALRSELQSLDKRREQIVTYLRGLGGAASARNQTRATTGGRRRKRIRRSREQLEREALSIYDRVKSAGELPAAELRRHHPKVGQDPKGFVKKYSGKNIKPKGHGRATVYVAS